MIRIEKNTDTKQSVKQKPEKNKLKLNTIHTTRIAAGTRTKQEKKIKMNNKINIGNEQKNKLNKSKKNIKILK